MAKRKATPQAQLDDWANAFRLVVEAYYPARIVGATATDDGEGNINVELRFAGQKPTLKREITAFVKGMHVAFGLLESARKVLRNRPKAKPKAIHAQ